jgi:hypothetical protein
VLWNPDYTAKFQDDVELSKATWRELNVSRAKVGMVVVLRKGRGRIARVASVSSKDEIKAGVSNVTLEGIPAPVATAEVRLPLPADKERAELFFACASKPRKELASQYENALFDTLVGNARAALAATAVAHPERFSPTTALALARLWTASYVESGETRAAASLARQFPDQFVEAAREAATSVAFLHPKVVQTVDFPVEVTGGEKGSEVCMVQVSIPSSLGGIHISFSNINMSNQSTLAVAADCSFAQVS